MLNPFTGDAFSLVSMTMAINEFPTKYGKVNQLGIFGPGQGLTQNIAIVERRNGVLNVLPSTPWGGPPSVNTIGKRNIVAVPIPHIPVVDTVLPTDVQGIRAFGTENQMETIDNLIAHKLEVMANKHDITLEYLRMGALKGQVIDGDGVTVLANMFTEFGYSQEIQDIEFSVAATPVASELQNLSRYFEDNLNGETMSEVLVLCSGEYWDALTTHATVQTAFQFYQNQRSIIRDDLRNEGFVFQGIRFVEYRGKASLPTGVSVRFVPANEAIAIPLGTQDVFRTFYAPANFNETVNTVGLPRYAKQEERRMGQGWDLWSESNPLPLNTRPDLVVRLTMS